MSFINWLFRPIPPNQMNSTTYQRWQALLDLKMGWERIEEDFPIKFNRDDVTRALQGRYNCPVLHVNPVSNRL